MTIDELKQGEYYIHKNKNIFKWGDNKSEYYFGSSCTEFKKGDGAFTNAERLATKEEADWLNYCIQQDKFISREEFLKQYTPNIENDLLSQAKLKYPIGTKFYPAHIDSARDDNEFCIVTEDSKFCIDDDESEIILKIGDRNFDSDKTYGNTIYDRIVYYQEKWAEIISTNTECVIDIGNHLLSLPQDFINYVKMDKIEVGDEVEIICNSYNNSDKKTGERFIVKMITDSTFGNYNWYHFVDKTGFGVRNDCLKLIKKASNTTKVDNSSPEVTNDITIPIIKDVNFNRKVHINIENKKHEVIVPLLKTRKSTVKEIRINSLTLTI